MDPDQADRIVGTGRDGKLSLSPHAFELEPRVVMIGGVLDDPANAVSAAWCRLLTAADRCRIESDQFVAAPERANDFGRLVDLNPEDLTIWPTIGNVGNGDDRAGAIQCLAGIEQLDQLLAGVAFFRQKLCGAPVTEPMETSHACKIAGYSVHKGPANIIVRNRVRDQDRRARGFA